MSLKHAKHNYTVCEYLYANTKFNDWIVTVAYYSSIHYICYTLFPNSYEDLLNGNITRFDSFNKYCRRLPHGYSKHRAIEALVTDNIPEIYDEFKTLKDNCWTARYDDYKIQDEIVTLCYDGMKSISEFCEDN